MIGFLNERSLEQYGDWVISLKLFLGVAQELTPLGSTLLKDSRFFSNPDVIRRFNSLAFPKDQRALMRDLVFGNRYYRCWTQGRVSIGTESYTCVEPALNLVDESLSEAAERKLSEAGEAVSLLSAPGSAFHNKASVTISKLSSGQAVELRNASSIETITAWIVSERGHYDLNSQSAPRDLQTVLIKYPDRFRQTGKVERRFSRHVFEEIATGRLYYVDGGHPGYSAHLEVFSATGEHLGIADINRGELDITAQVNGRVLRL
jgi:excinuclease UvrABC nuclease subunit